MGDYSNLNMNMEMAPKALRQAFGAKLKELGSSKPEIVVLDADLSSSTQTKGFAEEFPDRFFNIGIAEQDMVGIANGFAVSNKIPVISGFTCFTIGRAWEIIHTAAYDHLPIKICTTHAGLSNGRDGGSHQALEDLSTMAALGGTQIFTPCDPVECAQMLEYLVDQPGVCYMRMTENLCLGFGPPIQDTNFNQIIQTRFMNQMEEKLMLRYFPLGP